LISGLVEHVVFDAKFAASFKLHLVYDLNLFAEDGVMFDIFIGLDQLHGSKLLG
jgi:hypothetical protein